MTMFMSRTRLGGPRLALTALAVAGFLLFFFTFLTTRMELGYDNILTWTTSDKVELGDIRIVVFGSQDVLGSGADAGHARAAWPEQLCLELNCSSLTSFIPSNDRLAALTSNRVYGTQIDALRSIAQGANITDEPAADYYFVSDQYPVPEETPDLEAQIEQFLAQPAPHWSRDHSKTRQTLWVFTFGTWDIWNLAAGPLSIGLDIIDHLTSLIFAQAEVLLREATEGTATAFVVPHSPDGNETGNPTGENDVLDHFRLIIPKLFDITLTPGWLERALAPIPHSKAEQMRNAVALTDEWNQQMNWKLSRWQSNGNGTWLDWDEEDPNPELENSARGVSGADIPISESRRRRGFRDNSKAKHRQLRVGLQASSAGLILDALTEEELQRTGLRDGNGRGSKPEDAAMRFRDVWEPCLGGAGAGGDAERMICDTPDDHLFHDSFTIGSKAAEWIGRAVAEEVLDTFFLKPREPV